MVSMRVFLLSRGHTPAGPGRGMTVRHSPVSVLGGLHLADGGGHIAEHGVIGAQRGGGLGIDRDDAAVHHVVLRHHAGLEYLQRHIGGIGSELGVVDAAGGKCAVADEGIGPGIVGHARLNEGLGNGQLHGHHAVVGGGKDGVRLACQAGRGGNDLIRVDTGTLHIGDSLGIQVFLGLGNGRLGIRLRGGVQQAHGLNIRVLGKHHVQNKGGVQSVAGAGDPVDAGESRGGGVADGGVDDGGAQVLGGIDHALRRQGGDGDHGVIALAGHLGADLVEQALVILAVELRIVDGDAQLRRLASSSASTAWRISSREAWSSC